MSTPSDTPDTPRSSTRRLLVGGAALGLGAGLGLALWRRGAAPADGQATPGQASSPASGPASGPASTATGATAANAASAPTGPLPAQLLTLDGRRLSAADWQGRPVLLNFWAPWCGPCVKEMPELDRFAQGQAAVPGGRGALVIGVAIDEEAAVRTFIGQHPVHYPIVVQGYAGLAWVRQLAHDAGTALPFSALIDASGQVRQHKFGATDSAELSGWLKAI